MIHKADFHNEFDDTTLDESLTSKINKVRNFTVGNSKRTRSISV